MNKIPKEYNVGGQRIEVRIVERCDDNNLGLECLPSGYIEIAKYYNKDSQQSESSMMNTFYHELIHTILDTMGQDELNKDEAFVNTFAGFLNEAMSTAVYDNN